MRFIAAGEGGSVSGHPQTLLYRPHAHAQRYEHALGARLPLGDDDVFAVQRTQGPELAFSTSCAHVGAQLLPAAERPAFGGGAVLLWAPILPSRCLFTARDATGTYRILPAPRSGVELLARTLERLEVQVALAFDEARSEPPYPPEVTRHLDAALEQASVATLLFGDLTAGRPFWLGAAS